MTGIKDMATTANPPEGIHHYDSAEEVPWAISKYWHQRHAIFSKYDDGIWMTDDAWFGVTPEPVATRIAADIAAFAPASKTILIDAFAGAGGNTIAFALSGRWKQIFAIEKDPKVLACAKHNAEVYGVAKKIFWIQGDAFAEIPKRLKQQGKNAVVFGSPPWGGEPTLLPFPLSFSKSGLLLIVFRPDIYRLRGLRSERNAALLAPATLRLLREDHYRCGVVFASHVRLKTAHEVRGER